MIIFFDGTCGFCHSSVNWIIKRDSKRTFKFAPLQGETAKDKLGDTQDLEDSLIFLKEDVIRIKFLAVKEILITIKHPLRFLFYLIPTFIGNLGYSFVAKIRYRIFGKYETCRIPTNAEKKLFLP